MPVLTVKLHKEDRHITCRPGRSVRDVLDETDIRVRAGCNGMGACGLCRIKIKGGDIGEPSENEFTSLGTELLSQGVRLACQVKADHDLQIVILNPAPPSVWHSLDQGPALCPEAGHPLGMTVDLGTTHISITLLDLHAKRRLAGRRGLNPQTACGTDVLTRLISAKSIDQAERLSSQVIRAIGDGLHDIGNREGIDIRQVVRVALVGNTAMLALLSGQNYLDLLQPRYWTETINCLPVETVSWGASWGISPEAVIEVIPPLAGFVGSDLLAGIMATRLTEQPPGAILIDFGTNSEMALWDGKNLWVTSAAGGPAFEGCGITCGMPADPGAIYRINPDAKGAPAFDVIAASEPKGLCGSGLVDLLAFLVKSGILNNKGQFAPSVSEHGFTVYRGNVDIVLTKKDIDIFQRAKAAIGAGIEVLLKNADMGYHELRKIFIGGVFGKYLDIDNAREIGLLPAIPGHFIETAGNTALSGCEAFLLSPDAEECLKKIKSRAIIVNLSDCTDFGILFMEHLYLRQVAAV
ncbi:MAG: DUF4445 domain-containing protein [Nitrospirae bacterium]|nr:DUF4445 domain-containing protein [Nitrospirota bacterium]